MRKIVITWCAIVIGFSYLLPNHYPPWLSFHQELGAAVAFGPLMIWAAMGSGPVPAITWVTLVLSLVPAGQFLFGKTYFAGDAWLALLYLFGFSLAALAGSRYTAPSTRADTPSLASLSPFWSALVVSGLVSVAIALHQWLDLGKLALFVIDLPPQGRPFANLAQPNHLATLLLLGLAGLIFLFESRHLRAWIASIAAVFLIFGLVMTGSRSVLMNFLWLFPAYLFLRKRCALRTSPVAFFGFSIFFVAVTLLWPTLNQVMLLESNRVSSLERLGTPGIRLTYWLSMLDAAGRAPWLGYGWEQVGLAQKAVALDYPATHAFFDNAHNLFLDLILRNGIPLGLLLFGLLVAWFTRQFRTCRNSLSWASLIGVGFVFNHGMLEYPLNYAYFLLPVGFLMGALSTFNSSPWDKYEIRSKSPEFVLKFVAIFTSIIFGIVAFEYPSWENEWQLLRFEEANISNPAPRPPPEPILLTQISELIQYSRTKPVPGMSQAQLTAMRQVADRYGYPASVYRHALALALNDDPQGASQELARLCKMQSVKSCAEAKRQWASLTQEKYPQLAKTQLPEIPQTDLP